MAISLITQYPGGSDPIEAAWPFGKPRNITAPGDGLGTPWEAALVKEIVGLQQALLTGASITPSGTPDEVGASQYLQALIEISTGLAVNYIDDGVANTYTLTSLSGLEAPSKYFDGMKIRFTPLNTSNGPCTIDIESLGVKNVTLDGATAISQDAILAGKPISLIYNGTVFVIIREADEVSLRETFVSVSANSISSTVNIANPLGTDNVDIIASFKGNTNNIGGGSHVVFGTFMTPSGHITAGGFKSSLVDYPIILARPSAGFISIRVQNEASINQNVVVDYTLRRRYI